MAFKRTVTLRASFRFPAIRFDVPTLLSFSGFTHAHAKCPPVGLGTVLLVNLSEAYQLLSLILCVYSATERTKEFSTDQ